MKRALRTFCTFCTLSALAGCAPSVMPLAPDLQPPSARLMKAPEKLPDLAPGADLYQDNVKMSEAYVRETGRLRSLQNYVRTILKKK